MKGTEIVTIQMSNGKLIKVKQIFIYNNLNK